MSKFAAAILAATAAIASTTPSVAADKTIKLKAIEKNGETVYCYKPDVVTGSIMSRNICRTKEEWEKNGVMVAAANEKANQLAANPQTAAQN